MSMNEVPRIKSSGRMAEGLVLGPITTPSSVMYIGQLIRSRLAFVM